MKTITRILIILSAALVVVGVTIAVTDSSSTAQAAPNFQEGHLFNSVTKLSFLVNGLKVGQMENAAQPPAG